MARRMTRTRSASTRPVARRDGRVVDRGIPVDDVRRTRVVEEEVPARRSVIVEEPVDVVVDAPAMVVTREPWSPAQIASLAIGAMFVLLGAVALARAAARGGDLTATEVTVAGFHHTGLLGLLTLFTGLTLMGIAAVPGGARPLMIFFGGLLAAFGLLVAIAPGEMHAALGTHGGHGVLYLLAGLVLVLAAAVSPLFLPATRRRVVEEPTRTRRVVRQGF